MSNPNVLHELENIAHSYARSLMNAANATYSEDTESAARKAKTKLTSDLQAFLAGQAAPAPVLAAPTTADAPKLWAVIAKCGEGVIFDNEQDALWTLTGEGTGQDGFGVPCIGEEFRDLYADDGLILHRARLEIDL